MKNEYKILTVLFLFAILPLTVYFSQQNQTLSQHAQELSHVTPTPIETTNYATPTMAIASSEARFLSPTPRINPIGTRSIVK